MVDVRIDEGDVGTGTTSVKVGIRILQCELNEGAAFSIETAFT